MWNTHLSSVCIHFLLLFPWFALPLKVTAVLKYIEGTPLRIADEDFYEPSITLVDGSIPNLLSDSSIDLAGNAETQALRNFRNRKDLRIIYTLVEVPYRLVANKQRGIETLADLKGKRIGAFQSTSSQYFVKCLLATAGLTEADYQIVTGDQCERAPCGGNTYPAQLAAGQIDAVGLWEPSVELALQAIGEENAVVFQNKSAYREIYNLHTTTSKLENPTTRKEIVEFVRALMKAEHVFAGEPETVYDRVAKSINMDVNLLKAVWPVHEFNTTLAPDLEEVLVAEAQWISRVENSAALSLSDIQSLIDTSVIEEALAGM